MNGRWYFGERTNYIHFTQTFLVTSLETDTFLCMHCKHVLVCASSLFAWIQTYTKVNFIIPFEMETEMQNTGLNSHIIITQMVLAIRTALCTIKFDAQIGPAVSIAKRIVASTLYQFLWRNDTIRKCCIHVRSLPSLGEIALCILMNTAALESKDFPKITLTLYTHPLRF